MDHACDCYLYYKYDSKEEVIGRHYSISRNPDELLKLEDTFNKVMNGEPLLSSHATRLCRDGSTGRHILSANPVFEGNKVVGMEGFILDISNLVV